jgi:hypothetical protein
MYKKIPKNMRNNWIESLKNIPNFSAYPYYKLKCGDQGHNMVGTLTSSCHKLLIIYSSVYPNKEC